LLILAALGLKTRVLYRSVTTNLLIDSLTFALRNPERTFPYDKPALVVIFLTLKTDSALSTPLTALMGDTIVPQIRRLRNFVPLRSVLQYDIFADVSKDQPECRIDFFDVESMDALCNGFQTK